MILRSANGPLSFADIESPVPDAAQVQVRVEACGVCRTDLHVVDGELAEPSLPLIPGHEIVGRITAVGAAVQGLQAGDRVGVPWLGWTCGDCSACRGGRENLCERARFTGYTLNGGYADYAVADHRYCFPIADSCDAAEAAPLLCAGLIGYRSLRFAADAQHIGLYGFGAAAHIVAQVAAYRGQEIYAFVREGDAGAVEFANAMGCAWAGWSNDMPPRALDAAIIYAPAGELVPRALRAIRPGGTVVCAGIHMSDIPAFPYELLWHERKIVSVANLERRDGEEFLDLAARIPVKTNVERFALEDANRALDALRGGEVQGAAVLVM